MFCIYLLVMPKCRGKQIFEHGRFPEVGQKQKTEKKKEKEEKKKEKEERKKANNDNNNGQATHGARKHTWSTQAAWANYLHFRLRKSVKCSQGENLKRKM